MGKRALHTAIAPLDTPKIIAWPHSTTVCTGSSKKQRNPLDSFALYAPLSPSCESDLTRLSLEDLLESGEAAVVTVPENLGSSISEDSPLIMPYVSEPNKLLTALCEMRFKESLEWTESTARQNLKKSLVLYSASKPSLIIQKRRKGISAKRARVSDSATTVFCVQEMRKCQNTFRFVQAMRKEAVSLLTKRYLAERIPLPTSQEFLTYVLPNSPDHIYEHHVRMSRDSFQKVKEILLSEAPQFFSERLEASIEQQMYIAFYLLGFYGNGASVEEARVKFGVAQGTVINSRKRIVDALYSLLPKFIRWPGPEERRKLCDEVRSEYGFHDAFFVVDGTTHPFAFKPEFQSTSWYDRKCRYSMQALVTSDIHSKIINLVIGWPGSTHDARVLRSAEYMNENLEHRYFSGNEHGLGDAAFGMHKRVVPNYKAPQTDYVENVLYNREHSRMRVRSEHAIGRVKGRFQALRELRFLVRKEEHVRSVVKFISAGYVLHNILLDIGDEFQPPRVAPGLRRGQNAEGQTQSAFADVGASEVRERVKEQVLQHIGYM